MDTASSPDSVPVSASATKNKELTATLRRVAWFSILLGLSIEAMILVVKFGFGSNVGPVAAIIDTIEKIAWPFLVCFGIAFGQVIARGKTPLRQIRTMGTAGLLVAPVAFTAVRVMHKGMTTALDQASTNTAFILVAVLAVVKAAQYGTLASLIGRLQTRPVSTAKQHAAIGLASGLIFGSVTLLITQLSAESVVAVNVATQAINEVAVPVGCSLILFATKILKDRLT